MKNKSIKEWLVEDATIILSIGANKLSKLFNTIDDYERKNAQLSKKVEELRETITLRDHAIASYKRELLLQNTTHTEILKNINSKHKATVDTLNQELNDSNELLQSQIIANTLTMQTYDSICNENVKLRNEIDSINNILYRTQRY